MDYLVVSGRDGVMEGGGSGLGGGDEADRVPGEAIGGEVVVQGPPGLVICDAGEEALGFWGGLLGEGGESRQRARVPGEAEEAALVEVWGGLGKGVEGGAGGVVVCKAGEGEGGFGEGGVGSWRKPSPLVLLLACIDVGVVGVPNIEKTNVQ